MLIQLIYVSYYVLLMVILLPMIHNHIHFLWLLYISYGYYMLTMIYSHIKNLAPGHLSMEGEDACRELEMSCVANLLLGIVEYRIVALHLWVHRCSLLEWN